MVDFPWSTALEVVDAAHPGAVLDKGVTEVAADEPDAAGDECSVIRNSNNLIMQYNKFLVSDAAVSVGQEQVLHDRDP